MIVGNIASDGVTVTLTTGSLPTWLNAGAQVSAVKNNVSVFNPNTYITYWVPTPSPPATAPAWSSSTTYNFNDVVAYSGSYYTSTQYNNVNNIPPYSATINSNLPRIASIASSTRFTITTPLGGGTYTNGVAVTGARFYFGQPFTSAQNYFIYYNSVNQPPITTSYAITNGYFGSDGASSIDLGNGTAMWIFADTFWSDGPTTNRNDCTFIHNCIAIQTMSGSYFDASVDNFTFYNKTYRDSTAKPFFNDNNQLTYSWPMGGFLSGGRLFLIMDNVEQFQTGLTTPGTDIMEVTNYSTASSPANYTYARTPLYKLNFGSMVGANWVEETDSNGVTYLYTMMTGGFYATIVRFLKSDIVSGTGSPNFANIQFFCYDGSSGNYAWVNYNNFYDQDGVPSMEFKPIVRVTGYAQNVDNNSALCKSPSSGQWMWQCGTVFSNTPRAITVKYSSNLYNYDFGDTTNRGDMIYFAPIDIATNTTQESALWIYGAKFHPEQKWSGWNNDGVLLSYNTNLIGGVDGVVGNFNASGPATNYWPQLVQIAGL